MCEKKLRPGRGFGTVGRAIVSNIYGLWFESSRQQIF